MRLRSGAKVVDTGSQCDGCVHTVHMRMGGWAACGIVWHSRQWLWKYQLWSREWWPFGLRQLVVICMPAIFSSWRGGTFIGKLGVVGGVVHIYIYI
jgi:hypothetical protein